MSAWRDALTSDPEYWDFERWPTISLETLPKGHRAKYLRNCRIVSQVLQRTPIQEVAIYNGCSSPWISKLMNRCFQFYDGGYALTAALIPHRQLISPQRQIALPLLSNQSGSRCAFKALLKALPELKVMLDRAIAQSVKNRKQSAPLTPMALHGLFKQYLAELQWPRDVYPYTNASLAYESLRQYLVGQINIQRRSRKHRKSDSFSRAQRTEPASAMDRIQVDSQRIDFSGRLNLQLNDKLIDLRLSRANLYVAIDVGTDCILGYAISYRNQPDRWDVLRLIGHCIGPWEPRDLCVPGLSYPPGAEFPSKALAHNHPITFNRIEFDNAWVHHAHVLEDILVKDMGATLALGRPHTPTRRHWVEHAFDLLNRKLSHRLPSTTGCHPHDPKREPKRQSKKPPLMTWQMFEDALDVYFCQHNVTRQAQRLGGQTPLELFKHQIYHHWHPRVSLHTPSLTKLFTLRERLKVKSRKDSHARHVNLDRVRYSLTRLSLLDTNETEVDVEYDWRDMRSLKVYSVKTGRELGVIRAPASWQTYPHSKSTRQFINKLIRRERLYSKDALSSVLDYLIKNSGQPSIASDLLRITQDFTSGGYQISRDAVEKPQAQTTNQTHTSAIKKTKLRRTLTWNTESAYHGH